MSKRTILLTAIGVLAAVAVTMLSLASAQVAPPTNPLCKACPGGSKCTPVDEMQVRCDLDPALAANGPGTMIVVGSCYSDSQCPEGQHCTPVPGDKSGPGVCHAAAPH